MELPHVLSSSCRRVTTSMEDPWLGQSVVTDTYSDEYFSEPMPLVKNLRTSGQLKLSLSTGAIKTQTHKTKVKRSPIQIKHHNEV